MHRASPSNKAWTESETVNILCTGRVLPGRREHDAEHRRHPQPLRERGEAGDHWKGWALAASVRSDRSAHVSFHIYHRWLSVFPWQHCIEHSCLLMSLVSLPLFLIVIDSCLSLSVVLFVIESCLSLSLFLIVIESCLSLSLFLLVIESCLTATLLVCYWVLSLAATLCYRVLSLTVTLLDCYWVLSLTATLLACYWVLSHCHSSCLLSSLVSHCHTSCLLSSLVSHCHTSCLLSSLVSHCHTSCLLSSLVSHCHTSCLLLSLVSHCHTSWLLLSFDCYWVSSLTATPLDCYWVLYHCHSSWLLLSCLSQPHFLFVVDSHLPLGRLNTSVSDWPLRCRFQPPCFQMQLLCQLENSQIEITPLNMYNKFVERIRRNLHVVLAFSPIGDAFRNRLRMFPSLINCCTIDWFKVSEGDGRWWLV